MAEKHKLHNVRLDDEVWAAVKAMDCSLNQYLRIALLETGTQVVHPIPRPPITLLPAAEMFEPVEDSRPKKNARCRHCGHRFAGSKFATLCNECKSSGHTNQPNECPRCNEGNAI